MSRPRRLSELEQRDLLRHLDAKERVVTLQGRRLTDYLRDHFAAERAELAELVDAARDVLRGGDHDGPCTNIDSPGEACDRHWEAAAARKDRLKRALASFETDSLASDGVVAEIIAALRRHGWIFAEVERTAGSGLPGKITHPNASLTDLCTDLADAIAERYGASSENVFAAEEEGS